MSVQSTPWGEAIDALLADGQWHSIEAVVVAAMAVVPPGAGYRCGERRRREYAGAPEQRVTGTADRAVATGARRLVRNLLNERVRRGTVERQGDQVRRAR